VSTIETSGKAAGPVGDTSSAGPRNVSPDLMAMRRRDQRRKWSEIALFTSPALILFALFVVFPVASAARYSLYKWNGVKKFSEAEFIGFENYTRALWGGNDPATQQAFKTAYSEPFWQAVGHNVLIIVASMAIQLPLALIIALILNRKFPGRSIVRVIIFAPYVISEVIAGVMWFIIFDPYGIATKFVESIGLSAPDGGWFESQTWGIWTVFFVVTWKYLGLAIILFLAGLSGVPQELQEAASIDGASWWQVQRRINIPLIGPTIRIWVFLSLIGSIQLFDMVWVLNRGGTQGQYATIATFMMQFGYFRKDVGFGSAVAVIMFLISLLVAVGYMLTVLRRDNDNSEVAR